MINILVVPSDNMGGVGFYRSTQPHIQLEKQFPDEFSVDFNMSPNWFDLASLEKYDIIHVHKGISMYLDAFRIAINYCKSKGIVTILDVDDHWKLHVHHPLYISNKTYHFDQLVIENLRLFDYITTTTEIFAKEISKYNKNVFVIPNAIDPEDDRFKVNKKESSLIRVGMIMGSSHEYDVKLLKGMTNSLPKEVKDKIQFVLCGFDTRGTITMINPTTKEKTERKIKPEETVWCRYEELLTDNYKIIDERYKAFLKMYIPNSSYPNEENEHYRRIWTKDMNNYYQHYSNVDILLAPLEVNDFNLVKSPLKCAECCFSKTAIIASDFGPYTLDLKNAILKGGAIDPDGNALLVDEKKNHKLWAKYVTKLVNNPELLKQIQENIYTSLKDKYDLNNVTKNRAEIYKKLYNEKKH